MKKIILIAAVALNSFINKTTLIIITFIFQVEELPQNKVFDIFKTKKPVVPGDRVIYQTKTSEQVHIVADVWTGGGLMKGYSAVGFGVPVADTKPTLTELKKEL